MKYKYLESRPDRASGELTIKGTRIPIAQVINMLAKAIPLNCSTRAGHGFLPQRSRALSKKLPSF
jgi:hypothetical protein